MAYWGLCWLLRGSCRGLCRPPRSHVPVVHDPPRCVSLGTRSVGLPPPSPKRVLSFGHRRTISPQKGTYPEGAGKLLRRPKKPRKKIFPNHFGGGGGPPPPWQQACLGATGPNAPQNIFIPEPVGGEGGEKKFLGTAYRCYSCGQPLEEGGGGGGYEIFFQARSLFPPPPCP